MAHPHDLADRGIILDCLEHEIGHVRARDGEAETRLVAFSHAILSGVGLVRESRRTHNGPIETALFEDPLHRSGVSDDAWKKQASEKVRWRDDGIPEQERYRFDHDAPDSGVDHGACQRDSELL